MRPLIVVEGSDRAVREALEQVRWAGWTVVESWEPPAGAGPVVCAGVVASAEDAAEALLAAVAGAGLVVSAGADREVVDRLCEDLRRLGRLDHRVGEPGGSPGLTLDERRLADLLLEGVTLGEAARRLNLSRRTADRRLSSVRRKLGVETTAAALVEIARRRSL